MTQNPTAEWLARQITEVFPWERVPKYLIRDNDRAFKARVRAMGIRDRPTAFRSPWQNGYVERLIGSIRRECTDHLIVFNAEHLRRILAKYTTYYNEVRTHVSLGKDAPYTRQIERFGDIIVHPILGGLHHRYARIEIFGSDNGAIAVDHDAAHGVSDGRADGYSIERRGPDRPGLYWSLRRGGESMCSVPASTAALYSRTSSSNRGGAMPISPASSAIVPARCSVPPASGSSGLGGCVWPRPAVRPESPGRIRWWRRADRADGPRRG